MLSLGPRDKRVQESPIDAKKNMPIGGPPLPGSLYFHPMTISSPPSANGPLVLMIKNMGLGTWSEEVPSPTATATAPPLGQRLHPVGSCQ